MTPRRFFGICLIKGLAPVSAGLLIAGSLHAQTAEVFSKPHRIDRIIKSMEGEPDDEPFALLKSAKPELLWVTAAHVSVVDANSGAQEPVGMLCHSHLMFPFQSFDRNKRNALFQNMTHSDVKLFTVVQGQTDIELPANFGIPVFSNEPLDFSSMIISPRNPPAPLEAKAKGTFEFLRDSELAKPLTPLFWRGLSVMVPVQNMPAGDHCTSEMMGTQPAGGAQPAQASLNLVHQHKSGKYKESYHWMVPPGRHEYRYTLEYGLMTPFDTTLHYANMHLHPYAESLELRDLTTGQSIYKGLSENLKNEAGIAELLHFSSEKGIPIYKDHQYELITIYNNTTTRDVDAMAIMFIYLNDKTFDRDRLTLPIPGYPPTPNEKQRPD